MDVSSGVTTPRSVCPVTYALEIFGDRWTLLVLRDLLLEGRSRFRDLLGANEGIATNVLADRLRRLERRGLLSKTRDPTDARQLVYMPTETAIELVPMLIEMMIWSARRGQARVAPSFVARFEKDREALVTELQAEIRARIG
jgi:DNA-binding HxlR family transcriptional regulator